MSAQPRAMIRYTVRPGQGEPNAALVRDVYAELAEVGSYDWP